MKKWVISILLGLLFIFLALCIDTDAGAQELSATQGCDDQMADFDPTCSPIGDIYDDIVIYSPTELAPQDFRMDA